MHILNNPDRITVGSLLSCSVETRITVNGYLPANMVNGYGMSDYYSPRDVHDNHRKGATMWLGKLTGTDENWVKFDFGGVYPLGQMFIWNFNASGDEDYGADCGIRAVRIFLSVDQYDWEELKGAGYPYRFAKATGGTNLRATNLDEDENPPVDFNGRHARYVKIVADEEAGIGNWGACDANGDTLVGLSEVRFYAGKGYLVTEEPTWTQLFRRNQGWTGGDGIFSIPFDGDERPMANPFKKTLFLFSDTFIGTVDPGTYYREFTMLNNTLAVISGTDPDPETIRFIWRENDSNQCGTIFDPPGEDHFALKYENYFWLQDGIILDNNLYLTALNVYHDENGPEGLKFGVSNVSLIKCPIQATGPDIDSYEVFETPLYHEFTEGGRGFIGCGIFPNTQDAGAPDPDGYLYIYGYINKNNRSDLIVSRCPRGSMEDFRDWQFFDGKGWTGNMADCAIIAENVSHELSLSPLLFGPHKGKYILVFQKDINGTIIACRIGDNPWGPFSEMISLYQCPEYYQGEGMTSYNAKAHPHLSKPGELLISYNVNTFSMDVHRKNGDVYRPRFIKIRGI